MSIRGKLEAIIYAAEEPVSVDHLALLLKEAGLISELMAPPVGDDSQRESEDGEAASAVQESEPKDPKAEKAEIKAKLRALLDEMMVEYSSDDRGIELRQVAGGYRYSTKP